MLGIDQLEDYQDELVKLEDEINFEDREVRRRETTSKERGDNQCTK